MARNGIIDERTVVVKFILTMSKIGSWNGKWSGTDKEYALYQEVTEFKWVCLKNEYFYDFGDGWEVCIKVINPAVTPELGWSRRHVCTDGFCGYEWMVDAILLRGKIITKEDWRREQELSLEVHKIEKELKLEQ